MSTIEDVKAAVQTLTDAVNNLEVTPAPVETVSEVDVVEGSQTEKFVPETDGTAA